MTRKTRAGATARASVHHGNDERSFTRIEGVAQPERVVLIEPEAFGHGFDVRVIPPLDGEHLDAEFPTYKHARGWAGGLRMTRGWRIVDLAGEVSS